MKLLEPPYRWAAILVGWYAVADLARAFTMLVIYGGEGPQPERYWRAGAALIALVSVRGIWRGERPHWVLPVTYWILTTIGFVIGIQPLRSPHPRVALAITIGVPLLLGTLIVQGMRTLREPAV